MRFLITQKHPELPAKKAEYTSVVPLLLHTLEKLTHCCGMVSEERLRAVSHKILQLL
jgi:hypothetical protein